MPVPNLGDSNEAAFEDLSLRLNSAEFLHSVIDVIYVESIYCFTGLVDPMPDNGLIRPSPYLLVVDLSDIAVKDLLRKFVLSVKDLRAPLLKRVAAHIVLNLDAPSNRTSVVVEDGFRFTFKIIEYRWPVSWEGGFPSLDLDVIPWLTIQVKITADE